MGHWTVFVMAAFAFVMALLFATPAYSPVSLSFTAIGMLSSTVGFTLKRQEDSIASLERKLSDR